MVPRWRPAGISAAGGELAPLRGPLAPPPAATYAALAELISDWARYPDYGRAADLLSAAAVLGPEGLPDEVRDAARFVLEQTRPSVHRSVRSIAAGVLAPAGKLADRTALAGGARSMPDALREYRQATHRYAFNPLVWVDLARAHASLGHRRAAERSMRVALGLAPDHRFVLRSFTRLALHLGTSSALDTPVEAWERLRRSLRHRRDPWLVAAEIATAMVLDRTPKSVKLARELLSSNNFSPFHLSELAGALGSLEIDAGSVRVGRKLLGQALIQPTDNAVAQVAWTARNRAVSLLSPEHLEIDLTYEARAWEHYRAHQWDAAITEAERWHYDEPFAARPVQMATFVAAVPLGDFARSAQLAQHGLGVNPLDQGIRNNLAFALASQGKWRAAMFVLDKLKPTDVKADILSAYAATWGLIHFRQGLIAEGQFLYRAAIARAHKEKDTEDEALAALYLAREERLAGCDSAAESLRNATELVQKRPLAHLKAVLKQVEQTVTEMSDTLAAPQSVAQSVIGRIIIPE